MQRSILTLLAATLLAGCASTGAPLKQSPTPDPFCFQQTGNWLWPEPARGNLQWPEPTRRCPPVGWRTYTREDVERSGALDLEEFLRRDTLLVR